MCNMPRLVASPVMSAWPERGDSGVGTRGQACPGSLCSWRRWEGSVGQPFLVCCRPQRGEGAVLFTGAACAYSLSPCSCLLPKVAVGGKGVYSLVSSLPREASLRGSVAIHIPLLGSARTHGAALPVCSMSVPTTHGCAVLHTHGAPTRWRPSPYHTRTRTASLSAARPLALVHTSSSSTQRALVPMVREGGGGPRLISRCPSALSAVQGPCRPPECTAGEAPLPRTTGRRGQGELAVPSPKGLPSPRLPSTQRGVSPSSLLLLRRPREAVVDGVGDRVGTPSPPPSPRPCRVGRLVD